MTEIFRELSEPKIIGHVLIKDVDTGEVLLDKRNAINYENFSIAIAQALASRPDGHIFEMHFGNGGATVSGTGGITYFPPNVTGIEASLYNPTFFKVIDSTSASNPDPVNNNVEIVHTVGNTFTDIIISCQLEFGEPAGQETFDTSTNLNSDFTFNEIGLKSFNPIPGAGSLLTHIIFNPIQKSLNRQMQIIYTIRISMC